MSTTLWLWATRGLVKRAYLGAQSVMQRDGYAHPAREPQPVSRRDLLRLGRGPLFRADVDWDGATRLVLDEWSPAATAPPLLRGARAGRGSARRRWRALQQRLARAGRRRR